MVRSRVDARSIERAVRRELFLRAAPAWAGTKSALKRLIVRVLRSFAKLRGARVLVGPERRLAELFVGALLAGGTTPAAAIDLSDVASGNGGFLLNGISAYDYSGRSVASAGDVNGDGLADLIVGAARGDPGVPGTRSEAGESYVVFGKTDGTAIELSAAAAGAGGFIINGIDFDDRAGWTVGAAGDVNGDDLADLIVGAKYADFGTYAGESYVIFGKADGTPVELSAVAAGNGGFSIRGRNAYDYAGRCAASAGDVNGDGLSDLIVGARYADPGGAKYAGESYVVFGKTDGASVSLAAVAAGAGGFVMNGIQVNDYSGSTVASAGDVNGDGLADLLVGAYEARPGGDLYAGESYVVFGKATGLPVELSAVAGGTGGFVIRGIDSNDFSSFSLASAGDVNGDGLADVIVGAPFASAGGAPAQAGESYVVFGKSDGAAVELSAIVSGSGGFVMTGLGTYNLAGFSVGSAGDVNGDGLADLIVGAKLADPGGDSYAGEGYVVFGKTDGTGVNLSDVAAGAGGFAISGIDAGDYAGASAASAGDVNGDGLSDLILGAYHADPAGVPSAGESYVVFSPESAAPQGTYRMRTLAGDGPGGFIAPATDFGDVARVEIDYSDDDNASGSGLNGASNETVTIVRSGASISNLDHHAGVLWQITSDRGGFASAEVTLKYLAPEIASLGDEADFTIHTASSPAGPWTPHLTTRRPERNEVEATVSGFSFFTIVGPPPASAAMWEIYP